MPKSEPGKLNERQRRILQAVVEDFIATAEPVGSRTLTKRNRDIDLSAATVRNAMADLEELGYLSATHASAGRIPTATGFRVYVEQLANRGRISAREREIIQAVTFPGHESDQDIRQILGDAARVLATLSGQATLVMLPSLQDVVFADIEFVPVRSDSILAVFVAKSGFIQQRVLPVTFPVDREELRRMSNYLKSLLGGKTLREVRMSIVESMESERAAADQIMRTALELGHRALVSTEVADAVLLGGQRNFLEQPEFSDLTRMRALLRAFEEKTILLKLISTAVQNPMEAHPAKLPDTQVVFGADAGVREAKDLALVVTQYNTPGGPTGQLGVVGPLRLDYSKVIPLVEYTASSLSKSFGGRTDNDDEDG